MAHLYILEGKTPVPVYDIIKWAIQSEDRKLWTVDKTDIGDIMVSTIFLGIDHSMSFKESCPPILFETMVFGGVYDKYMWRYETWEEAEKGHKEACDMVLGTFSIEEKGLKKLIIESLN